MASGTSLQSRIQRRVNYWRETTLATTRNTIVGFVAVQLVMYLMLVAFTSAGLRVPLLLELLGFSLLTITPGALVLGIAGFDLDSLSSFIYTVAVSLVSVTAWFTLLNAIYLSFPYVLPPPLAKGNAIAGTVALSGLLVGGFIISGTNPSIPSLTAFYNYLDNPVTLLLFVLPFIGGFSGVFINRYQARFLAIIVIVLIAVLVPVFFVLRINENRYPLLAWSVALTLLLQNSVRTIYLNRGDGKYEYYLARVTMEQGYWDPAIALNKNSMLRVMVLHPVFTAVTDIPLFWEFKLIHPLLFSTIAVGMYLIFRRQFGAPVAILSVLTYVFLHPFYNRLSRDTRTGIALFFLVACVLLWTETEISHRKMSILTPILLFGLLTAHYGTFLLFLFMVSGAVIFVYLESKVSGNLQRRSYIAIPLIAGAMMFVWYNYTSSGQPFRTLAILSIGTLVNITESFGLESRATQVISTGYSSFTMQFIKYEFIVVTLLSAIGYIIATFNRPLLNPGNYSGRLKTFLQLLVHNQLTERILKPGVHVHTEIHTLYYYLAGMGFIILLLAFAPIDTFGIARIYLIGGIFVIPFGVFLITFGGSLSPNSDTGPTIAVLAFGLLIAGLLLVNSGVVSAVALHEKNPQPNLDRQGIVEHGDKDAVFTLYARYIPEQDYGATVWLQSHKQHEYVFTSGGLVRHYPSYLTESSYDERKPPGVAWNSIATSSEALESHEGYIMIDEYVSRTNSVGVEARPGKTINTVELKQTPAGLHQRSRIYANGQASVYLTD